MPEDPHRLPTTASASVAELAKAWHADCDRTDRLSRRWQTLLERRLQQGPRPPGAITSEMAAIEVRLPALSAAVETAAARIATHSSLTLQDVLAKVQVALHLSSPHDGEGLAHLLLKAGCEDLARILGPPPRPASRLTS